ncbi:MAG: hypothetical protein ACI9XK_003274 [Granulosicoccus sp.]|jgi:hypothetical protein
MFAPFLRATLDKNGVLWGKRMRHEMVIGLIDCKRAFYAQRPLLDTRRLTGCDSVEF